MESNRMGEYGQTPPRSSRIFAMESLWYFTTREGADIGPFGSCDEASNGLQDFIQFIGLANKQTLKVFLSALSEKERHSLFN